jgi:hypothetical protein
MKSGLGKLEPDRFFAVSGLPFVVDFLLQNTS